MNCAKCHLKGKCLELRKKTANHFKWSIHNILGHPLSELLWILGFDKASDSIHNKTLPKQFQK